MNSINQTNRHRALFLILNVICLLAIAEVQASELDSLRALIRSLQIEIEQEQSVITQLSEKFNSINVKIYEYKADQNSGVNPFFHLRMQNAFKKSHELADSLDSLNKKLRESKSKLQNAYSTAIQQIEKEIQHKLSLAKDKSRNRSQQKKQLDHIRKLENEKAEYAARLHTMKVDEKGWAKIVIEPGDTRRRLKLKAALLEDFLRNLSIAIYLEFVPTFPLESYNNECRDCDLRFFCTKVRNPTCNAIKRSIQLKIGFLLLFGINTAALPQSDPTLNLSGKISGEFRSNINRQPGLEKDEDFRLNLIFYASKKWQLMGKRTLALSYDLQHYRYGESSNFTRYDQTLWGQFVQRFGLNYKFTVSNEFRFRYHPSTTRLNYTKNILDLNVKRKVGGSNNLILGYKNWTKTYPNNSTLSRYVSHRTYVKLNHEFSRRLNLGAKIEYQNHRGNLYAGSTAPQQSLNVSGNRFMLRLNFDRVFSRKLVTSVSYKYELDLADDFEIEGADEDFDDEDTEEFLAEDSDFGYAKHQSSVSMHLRANSKISFLFFFLYYTKGFQYWHITPEGPKRHDKVLFFSHKVRLKLSKKFGIDIRHNFEANRTNLDLYKYNINSVAVGLNIIL